MNRKRLATTLLLLCFIALASLTLAQDKPASPDDKKPAKNEAPEPRTRDGRKLLTALDLLKVAGVSAPRISPDGSRVAYTVSETKMEKDKEWKAATQVWVVLTSGGKARQYTRGEKSSSAPEWSPDGN